MCPNCNSTRLSVTSTEKRTAVDVPEPIPYSVNERTINVYRCSRCGADALIPEFARRELPASSLATTDSNNKGNGIVTLGRTGM
ncbi:MAG: IS66 family transposase zinc-finger binding domain-containing protein [archaeon]|nr:IS66 family transposase zinc-finger binding domain-containing protein [archaeon]